MAEGHRECLLFCAGTGHRPGADWGFFRRGGIAAATPPEGQRGDGAKPRGRRPPTPSSPEGGPPKKSPKTHGGRRPPARTKSKHSRSGNSPLARNPRGEAASRCAGSQPAGRRRRQRKPPGTPLGATWRLPGARTGRHTAKDGGTAGRHGEGTKWRLAALPVAARRDDGRQGRRPRPQLPGAGTSQKKSRQPQPAAQQQPSSPGHQGSAR